MSSSMTEEVFLSSDVFPQCEAAVYSTDVSVFLAVLSILRRRISVRATDRFIPQLKISASIFHVSGLFELSDH